MNARLSIPLALLTLTGCSGPYFEASDPRHNTCIAAGATADELLAEAFDAIEAAGYSLEIRSGAYGGETDTVRQNVWVGDGATPDRMAATAWHEYVHVLQSRDTDLMALAAPRGSGYRWSVEVQGLRQNAIVFRALGWDTPEVDGTVSDIIDEYGWDADRSEDARILALNQGCK